MRLSLSLPGLFLIKSGLFVFFPLEMSLLLFFQFYPIAFRLSVVVACQSADQFLFSVPSDAVDVTFEILVSCDVDSHFISQVFGVRFLLGVHLEFLD